MKPIYYSCHGINIFGGLCRQVVALYRSLCTRLHLGTMAASNSGHYRDGFTVIGWKCSCWEKTCTHNHNVDCGETQLKWKGQSDVHNNHTKHDVSNLSENQWANNTNIQISQTTKDSHKCKKKTSTIKYLLKSICCMYSHHRLQYAWNKSASSSTLG